MGCGPDELGAMAASAAALALRLQLGQCSSCNEPVGKRCRSADRGEEDSHGVELLW
jgi:hypothetical protein